LCAFCVHAPAQTLESKGKVRLVYIQDWTSSSLITHLAGAVLERMRYETQLIPASAPVAWQAVARGDADALLSAWLPRTHAIFMRHHGHAVQEIGTLVEDAETGIGVNANVATDSLAGLNGLGKLVGGRIIGVEPDADLMEHARRAVREYTLTNLSLVHGSGQHLAESVSEAVESNRWIAFTAWRPHWLFAEYDLKILDDPRDVFPEPERIAVVARDGLARDLPEVHDFLSRFFLPIRHLETLMNWNRRDFTSSRSNATRFLDQNPDLVRAWTN
jgi:glycine betaine/proline transport system substrate-binding protein